jgi:hypothetical protein
MKYILIALALMLGGCAQTTGKKTDVATDLIFRDNTNCTFNIYPAIDQESKTGSIEGSAENKTDVPVDLDIPLTKLSPTKIIKDSVEKDVLAEVVDAVKPDAPVETANIEIVELRPFENKSFNWLPHTGSYYGKDVRFVFDNNCGELLVPDGSVTHGADGNPNNYNQMFFFSGTDFPVGSAENNSNRASVFTAPGCVATKVTITKD